MNQYKVTIIAEAGVNHNGDLKTAFQLIDVAAEAQVDYVKFQTFKAETIASPNAKKAIYQEQNTRDGNDSQFDMLKNLELSDSDHRQLLAHARSQGVAFFSTAFDVEGLIYLDHLGLDMFKIPSGEITNYPYLRTIAGFGKPVILSTGMATLGEIEKALSVLTSFGCHLADITVLHCNTEYPTPMGDVNLKAMNTISTAFGVKVGYSDHTLGIEVPIAATALGATVIEKHFTLDRNLPGPDHRASLEPSELKAMVRAIRNTELALSGSGRKEPSDSESKNKTVARKSIHLSRPLKKGDILTEQDILALRPGDGISAMEWNTVLGRRLSEDRQAFDKLNWSDLS